MQRNLYTEVSDRIIAEREHGAAPWLKPWSATAGVAGAKESPVFTLRGPQRRNDHRQTRSGRVSDSAHNDDINSVQRRAILRVQC